MQDLTDAERQMIEILRSTKDDFSLTISRDGSIGIFGWRTSPPAGSVSV